MQEAWSLMTGGQDMQISYAFLYGWSVLMEEFSPNHTVYPVGRVLVGLWMLACVILTNTYRSSLVAHLIVQDKMPAINSFQDLLARDGWGWGTSFKNDATSLFFKYHPDSDIKKIHQGMQYAPAEEQFQRVLKGSYSHLTYKNLGMAFVAASITDANGYTPIHVGKTEYLLFVGIGWGFRRGAPFRDRFSAMMHHLVDGGLIDYWIKDLISSHMRNARAEKQNDKEKGRYHEDIFEVTDGKVSLGLTHLQGSFYLLLLGCGLASLAFLVENCANYKLHLPSLCCSRRN
ncbi:glutamate receptor ionotropic, NMDA 3B-like [Panulirus ornatus]|uniref:glutamate receptor ionotropic, NMDA 3B-like n=1 Tax=Panulirus ornatus TaxID=150431 RepID=UPI003A878397